MTQIDLNLLEALDVLLAEGSVTVAAERLNLSVPATSRTLARVRVAFDDPILVRAGRGLVPTPRALALQGRLHRLIEEAHALVEMGRALDLAALERTFTIRANDSLISLVAAPLVGQVQRDAPGVRLRFVPEGLEDLAPLRNGAVDIDFGVIHGFGPEVRTEELYREHLVGLVAADHRLATGRVTLRRLAAAAHVNVSRLGSARGTLDAVLDEHGLARRVVAVVPNYPSAADMVLTSDLVGLFPSRYADQVAAVSGARTFPIPAELPDLTISQAWHLRFDTDPAHLWLRGQLRQATGQA
jgi:DNA-binding transcriptional LysR family regulator